MKFVKLMTFRTYPLWMKIKRKIRFLSTYYVYRIMLLKQIREICTKTNNIYTIK